MAIFSVLVRDYHWSKNNYRVQSPNLDLNSTASNFIIRPLQGNNKDESRIVDPASDLRDDIKDEAYQTEAHGVFISATRESDYFPVWVPIQGNNVDKKKENETYVVNLNSYDALNVDVAQICWIPSYEAPDGKLYTAIGTRKMGHDEMIICILQQTGFPRQAKFELVPTSVLSRCKNIDEARKQQLFHFQLTVTNMPYRLQEPVMTLVSQIFVSPYRLNCGRRQFQDILDENVNIPRHIARCFGGDFLDVTVDDNDSDSTHEDPSVHQVGTPNQPYVCGCKYSDLGPTLLNRHPPHTHVKDDECPLGSGHSKHCIFANHRLGHCVIPSAIPGSNEAHNHCPHLLPSYSSNSPTQSSGRHRINASTEIPTSTGSPIGALSLSDSEMETWQFELEDHEGGASCFSDAERLLRPGNTDIFDTASPDQGGYGPLLPDTPQTSVDDPEADSLLNMTDAEMMGLDDSPDIVVYVDQYELTEERRRVNIRDFCTPGPHDMQM
ncbi:hypothetical protein F5X96DRAFT_85146 [Biscogniauxia mediterranea]|nr:hypothetical protein F5X96DRAFT_85146 [Biscogniauxia mediterranea]